MLESEVIEVMWCERMKLRREDFMCGGSGGTLTISTTRLRFHRKVDKTPDMARAQLANPNGHEALRRAL